VFVTKYETLDVLRAVSKARKQMKRSAKVDNDKRLRAVCRKPRKRSRRTLLSSTNLRFHSQSGAHNRNGSNESTIESEKQSNGWTNSAGSKESNGC